MRDTLYLREANGDGYFQWLADDVSLHKDGEYWCLLRALHRKDFYVTTVKKDFQLYEDGLYLRHIYKKACKGYDDSNLPLLPSCLEVLYSLALRLEVADLDYGHQDWFWIMISNLGLEDFNDERYYELGGTDSVYYILSRWLTRTYKHDGSKFNIFSTKNWKLNFRTMDWLSQGYIYIRENIGIGFDDIREEFDNYALDWFIGGNYDE